MKAMDYMALDETSFFWEKLILNCDKLLSTETQSKSRKFAFIAGVVVWILVFIFISTYKIFTVEIAGFWMIKIWILGGLVLCGLLRSLENVQIAKQKIKGKSYCNLEDLPTPDKVDWIYQRFEAHFFVGEHRLLGFS